MDDPFALLDALPTRSSALSRGQKRTYGRVLQDDVAYGLPSPPTTSSPPPASSPGGRSSSSPLAAIYNDSFTSRRPRSATPSPSLRTSKRLKTAATAREAPQTPTKSTRTAVVAAAGKMGRQTTLVASTGTIRSLSSTTSGTTVRASKRAAVGGSTSKDVLTQTKLNLLPARAHCKTCGMSYTRTDATDCALHDDFHRAQLDGVPVPARLLAQSASAHSGSGAAAGTILPGALIDTIRLGLCKAGERALVRAALEFVDLELASTLPALDARQYTAFLYRHKNRVIAVLLCEPRARAHRLLPSGELDYTPSDAHDSIAQADTAQARTAALQESAGAGGGSGGVEEGTTRCAMGVSRMWTCRALRRRGIMSELLDFARGRYVVGARVGRAEVAYTQLSASGEAFLRRYLDPASDASAAGGEVGVSAPSMLVYAD